MKIKNIVLYTLFFAFVLLVNHLMFNPNSISQPLKGDFSSLGVTKETPIVIYTSKKCGACKALKKYFDEKELLKLHSSAF
jgi:thioredoxin-related protein